MPVYKIKKKILTTNFYSNTQSHNTKYSAFNERELTCLILKRNIWRNDFHDRHVFHSTFFYMACVHINFNKYILIRRL